MATLEIDQDTFERIVRRAGERGLSTREFVDAMSLVDENVLDVAELDRRSARAAAGAPTIAHEDVVRWLETWGTRDYKPWDKSRRA